jgi:catechol 2,3-dioxygenase-like lactoylglutathione lyase family enzyme
MNTLDIIVADIESSIEFYRRLGLDFKVDPGYPDHAGCDLANGVHLMFDQEKFTAMARPGWERGAGSPPVFLSFQFSSPEAVDAKYAELIEAGYVGSREPWDAFWGHRFATVLDPDGNGIDLFCPLSTQS